jgi:hypothetical protein
MIELGVFLLVAIGACWLFGALIAGVFKLTFGLVGAIFGGLFGAFALTIVALAMLPVLLLALVPLLVPALCIAALAWVVVRASRSHDQPQSTQGEARIG